jgi:hypothetical protein
MLLTGELGIFYEDLHHLVKPLHKVIYIPSSAGFLPDHGPA